ncbi:hypothetical protein JOC77_001438 [Peribacillus deserti]|uniref:Uncharacterized protein n=1 Tax=Peribacillus deserti TaxID=673318 RepID=A0ABS2QFS3_9BACI|nr:hypothetical protein [Peribacillus deserti]
MATLPFNLEASQKVGVPKDIRETVLPLGASMHKDRLVLGVILKNAYSRYLKWKFTGFDTILYAVLIDVSGGTVMGAISSGGMVAEMHMLCLWKLFRL